MVNYRRSTGGVKFFVRVRSWARVRERLRMPILMQRRIATCQLQQSATLQLI